MNNQKSVLLNDPDQLMNADYNGEDWVPETEEWSVMKSLSICPEGSPGVRFDHMLELVVDQFEASFETEGTGCIRHRQRLNEPQIRSQQINKNLLRCRAQRSWFNHLSDDERSVSSPRRFCA